MKLFIPLLVSVWTIGNTFAFGAETPGVTAVRIKGEVASLGLDDAAWKGASEQTISLMAQPMMAPRPAKTATEAVRVQAVHDGRWIAFRLMWKDPELSEAGKLGEFSDAVALQFPVKPGAPPPIFMGSKDQPVHIYHWRAQYQADKDKGMRTMKDIYANMAPDMYPMEFSGDFKKSAALKHISDEQSEMFSHGRAAGNPQSFKKNGVDEVVAEGFGSSAVMQDPQATSDARWKNKEWTVVIRRPLKLTDGSTLLPGGPGFLAFAVWQGGKDEVGGRKSVTMNWTSLQVQE